MPNQPALSGDLWLQVLVYINYFDLCKVKRVNRLLNDCCKVRSVQEDLYLAPFQERSIKSKYQAGEKNQIHPALSDVVHVLENGLLTLEKYGKPWTGTFQIKKVTRKAFVGKSKIAPQEAMEESFHKLDKMRNLGFENVLEPWDETSGEREDEWYDELCQFAPLCSCKSYQTCYPWNDKCWEKFIKLQKSKVEAIKTQGTDQMNSSAMVLCKTGIISELRLYAKGGIVADLNHIKFAKYHTPERPLQLGPLTAALL